MSPPRNPRARSWIGAAAVLGGWLVFAAPHAQDAPPERVHRGSGGQIPAAGVGIVRLAGLSGTLVLRGGRPGEIRYEARTLDDRRTPHEIAVDRTAPNELRIGPLDPTSPERLLVEVTVAPQVALRVTTADSRVVVSSIGGAFDLDGERLDADIRGNYGPVRAELRDSKLKLDGTSSDVHVQGRGIEGELGNVGGAFGLEVEASRVAVDGVGRDADVAIHETTLLLARIQGNTRIVAGGGTLELREPSGEVEARLEGTPLKLSGSAGVVRIETDAAVEFSETAGHLTIESFGASVRGSTTAGPIAISTSQADVVLDGLGGAADVRGDGLGLQVSKAKSEVQVEVTSSRVDLRELEGGATVSNDFGDVSVTEVAGPLTVHSRNGRVRVEGAKGPVEVRADGDEVSVEWIEMPGSGEQVVENAGGAVVVRIPVGAQCRVEAESTYGHVVSEFEAIRETAERSASGTLNGGAQPLVRIRAGGDVEIGSSAAR